MCIAVVILKIGHRVAFTATIATISNCELSNRARPDKEMNYVRVSPLLCFQNVHAELRELTITMFSTGMHDELREKLNSVFLSTHHSLGRSLPLASVM